VHDAKDVFFAQQQDDVRAPTASTRLSDQWSLNARKGERTRRVSPAVLPSHRTHIRQADFGLLRGVQLRSCVG
jgi:hypothetical protein